MIGIGPVFIAAAMFLAAGPSEDAKPAAGESPAVAATLLDGMVLVPAGDFVMGCTPLTDKECQADEQPAHKPALAAFLIDRAEVTLADFKKCVDAGRCTKPLTKEDNQHCNWGQLERDSHPVNCVGWAQANEYCVWAGKRLPTEAEWEKAARGPDGNDYPWGKDKPDCSLAVISHEGEGCGKGGTWPVCSKAPGNTRSGLCDMVGNVWEWVADFYAPDYYSRTTPADPAGPATGTERVLKGGAWTSEMAQSVRASVRLHFPAPTALGNFGFRCAKNAP